MARKRILIGDDDASILKMTRMRLEHEGFDVVVAGDGQEVLDQVDAEPKIHLVLLDIKMPKLNGYEVCRRIKAQAATSAIPVIVFSASESQMQQLANRCIEAGATDWIKKPFRTKDLLEKIHRALEGEDGTDG